MVLIDLGSSSPGTVIPKEIGGSAWLAEGSGPAHSLRFRLEPELVQAWESVRELPSSDGRTRVNYRFALPESSDSVPGVAVIVEYLDDWGCLWESRRFVQFDGGDAVPTREMTRRIVLLPPKTRVA